MFDNPAERATVASVIITTAFGAVEVFLALTFGVVAFLAAGVDALFDTLTSILVLAGLRISKRPADRGHPYGHLQAETLVSAFLSVALIIAALRIEWIALDNFYIHKRAEAAPLLFLVAVLSIAVLGALSRYKIRIGRQTRNSSVVADGFHTLTDTVSSASVLVGLVFISVGYYWVDTLAAIFISVIILRWGLVVGLEALNVLMGASPGANVVNEIRRICLTTPGVEGCHKCRARRVGSRILADVHILVDPKLNVEKSHEVSNKVERRLKSKILDLKSVVIHVEPVGGSKVGKNRR